MERHPLRVAFYFTPSTRQKQGKVFRLTKTPRRVSKKLTFEGTEKEQKSYE
jgi:hypothetical protein